jgi:hypothetical protein
MLLVLAPSVEPAQRVAQAHDVADDGGHRRAQAGGGDVVGEVLERADDDPLGWCACRPGCRRRACRASRPKRMSERVSSGSGRGP